MVEIYWNRLKKLMDERGVSTKQLAEKVGITPQAIQKVKNGGSLGTVNNAKAAKFLGVSSDWLATGAGEMLDSRHTIPGALRIIAVNDDLNQELSRIRRVSIRACAGISGYEIDQSAENIDSEPIYFKTSWLISKGYKDADLIAIKVTGESMEPGIHEGDIIVLNTGNTTLKDGCAYVFNLDGEIVVKRAIRDAGQWWLDSDNPNKARFPRKSCIDGNCIVIGKVVQKQSMRI